MTPTELKAWTFDVAVKVVKFVEGLPREPRSWVLSRQTAPEKLRDIRWPHNIALRAGLSPRETSFRR